MAAIGYRREIDGLRAIAVISVVAYHAELTWFNNQLLSGGFLGVDIFFVISGFLITRIILDDINSSSFSFLSFYDRRIRRILPALFSVLSLTSIGAWLFLLPKALEEFGDSLLGSLFFYSNIVFLLEDSYVAEASQTKPLLHTWSLAVEEQFYLIVPIFLLLIFKYFRASAQWMLLMLALASFLFALWATQFASELSFFLLPSRMWELLCGSILASMMRPSARESRSSWLIEAVIFFGLLAIVVSLSLLDKNISHPSWPTLIPVFGTVILLKYGDRSDLAQKALANAPMVYLGKLSYSFYLVHFPIFAFARVAEVEPSLRTKALCIAVSILAAHLSFRFVEVPFRRHIKPSLTYSFIGILMSGLIILAVFISMTEGARQRLPQNVRTIYADFERAEFEALSSDTLGRDLLSGREKRQCFARTPLEACEFGTGRFVTLGDSFAGVYERALLEKLPLDTSGLVALAHGICPFVTNVWFYGHAECPLVNDLRWERIRDFESQRIFIVAASEGLFWAGKRRTADPLLDGQLGRTEGDPLTGYEVLTNYKANLEQLLELGHIVVQIVTVQRPEVDVRQIYIDSIKGAQNMGSVQSLTPLYTNPDEYDFLESTDEMISLTPTRENLITIYPREIFCESSVDKRCELINEHGALFNNGRHYSIHGARLIIARVFEELQRRDISIYTDR